MKSYANGEEIKGVAIAGEEVLGVAKAGKIIYEKEIYRRVNCLIKKSHNGGSIITGIKPTQNTRVKMVFSLLGAGNRSPFGGRTSVNNSTFGLLILNNVFVFDYGSRRVGLRVNATNDTIYEVDFNRNEWRINETSGVVGAYINGYF